MKNIWLGDRFEEVDDDEADRLVKEGYAQHSKDTPNEKLLNSAQMAAQREAHAPPADEKVSEGEGDTPAEGEGDDKAEYKTRQMKAKK